MHGAFFVALATDDGIVYEALHQLCTTTTRGCASMVR